MTLSCKFRYLWKEHLFATELHSGKSSAGRLSPAQAFDWFLIMQTKQMSAARVRLIGLLALFVLQSALRANSVASARPEGPSVAKAVAAIDQQIEELRSKLAEVHQQIEELAALRKAAFSEPVAHRTRAVAPQTPAPRTSPPRATSPSVGAGGLYDSLTAEKDPRPSTGLRPGTALFDDKIKIGGYGSFRFETNNIDLGPRVGDLPRLKRGFNSFDFRRFVVTLDATPTDRLRFYAEVEMERLNQIEIERNAIPENRGRVARQRAGVRFIQEVEGTSGGELAVEQAWAQFDFNDKIGARMGVVLPPVGRFNLLHEDNYWDLPRRPLAVRGGPALPVKSAWRELGAGVVGNVPWGEGFFDYQVYVVNGAQLDFAMEEVVSLREGRNLLELEPELSFSNGAFNGTNTANALTWRTAFRPRLGHEFAFSGYHGEYTPDYLLQDGWVNTLAFDGKTTRLGILRSRASTSLRTSARCVTCSATWDGKWSTLLPRRRARRRQASKPSSKVGSKDRSRTAATAFGSTSSTERAPNG